MAPVVASIAVGLAFLLPMVMAECQSEVGGMCGDGNGPREAKCCTTGYCQPWNKWYYQCVDAPAKCPNQETDIDYYGNDLKTIHSASPSDCCESCSTTSRCVGYTFVNENEDGRTACYLKSSTAGRAVKVGAVSAALKVVTPVTPTPTPPSSTCSKKVGDGCGNAQAGSSCCPSGSYCQPWNQWYYQCVETSAKCPKPETDIDYFGNDLQTIFSLSPAQCCDKCSTTSGCAGYTFINENPDGKTACFLKKSTAGRAAKKGALSAPVTGTSTPTPTPTPTSTSLNCPNKLGDGCGNAQAGSSCCPTGSYCQPWNQWYYQCVAVPPVDKCPEVIAGVDLFGDDLRTVYGLLPNGCCDACFNDPACEAYTFVNDNADGKTACYLKKGEGMRKTDAKAISGYMNCYI